MNKKAASTLRKFEKDMRGHMKTLLGYPENMSPGFAHLAPFLDIKFNNAGDPFVPGGYKMHSRGFELEVIRFFARLFRMPKDETWGYVTSGGTEGNLYGIFVGRELHPTGILYFSEDAHYSIRKIARILNMRSIVVRSQQSGEIDYDDLDELLKMHRDTPAIVCANIGTTMKGAIDDIEKIFRLFEKNKITDYYVHCDAALFGMIVPFVDPSSGVNFTRPIGSIAISGHKFIGAPMPCGVVLARRDAVKRIERKVEYIGSLDTTISGSRSGHAPLVLWSAVKDRGMKGFAKEAKTCIKNARWLYDQLQAMDYPSMLNEFSNTVVLKVPPDPIIKKWQLAVQGEWAHVVVLQHADKKVLQAFLADLKKEIKHRTRSAPLPHEGDRRTLEENAVIVQIRDVPGALAEVAGRLGTQGINLTSTHTIERSGGFARIAFTTDNPALTREVLKDLMV